jgi:hypothetical protein
MEPIAIVKKRSQIWLIMIVLIVAVLLIAAALWFTGAGTVPGFDQAPQSGIYQSWLSTAQA